MTANQKAVLPTPENCYKVASYQESHLHEALKRDHQTQVNAFCTLFAAYLAILDQCPEDEQALQRLYRVVLLFTTSPPRLPEIMARVQAHYECRFEINPSDSQACVRLCQVERILHGADSEAGMTWVKKALEIDPDNADAHLELAYQYERQGKLKDAQNEADHAIHLNPDNADAYAFKALIIKAVDRVAGLREYRKCLEKDPTHFQAIVMLKALEEGMTSVPRRRPWWKLWRRGK